MNRYRIIMQTKCKRRRTVIRRAETNFDAAVKVCKKFPGEAIIENIEIDIHGKRVSSVKQKEESE